MSRNPASPLCPFLIVATYYAICLLQVPLQFTSLAVVTLPFTLPFLLDLQAAGTAAVLEGTRL